MNANALPVIASAATDSSYSILLYLLILAIVLESAFAVLFNWRAFTVLFAGKAWKTPIMFVAAYAVVSTFDLDFFGAFVKSLHMADAGSVNRMQGSTLLTALFLAGGSTGVNNLLEKLGYRKPMELPATPLDENHAWISVCLVGAASSSQYVLRIQERDPDTDLVPIAGLLYRPNLLEKLKNVFFVKPWRYPEIGGKVLAVNKSYQIYIEDRQAPSGYFDLNGKRFEKPSDIPPCCFASRAVLDFVVKVSPT